MNTGAAIAAIVVAAALGAGVAGWVANSQPKLSPGAVATNIGYVGPASAPLGDIAGRAIAGPALSMPNPLGTGPEVIAEGHRLFERMNCAGCHGYTGKGGMGPNLTDAYWRYGGTPVAIYKTLYEGRPQGMPAWGKALPPKALWELTAYVGSLGGGVPPSLTQEGLQGGRAGDVDVDSQKNAAEGGNALEGQ